MKRFLLFLLLLHFSDIFADHWLYPFETDILNGCYLDGGAVRLLKELPSQKEAENVVISCAKPLRIFFQEDVFARKAGAKNEELIQIKKAASEYTPQYDDPEAKHGYIDFTKLATYQYQIQTPGEYTVWFRVWVPSVANWQFFASDNQGGKHTVGLKESIPSAKKWFWKKGFTIKLDKGNHQLDIIQAMNGKRISTILLTRDSSFIPHDDIPVSSIKKISKGSVQFKTASPSGLLQWSNLSANTKGDVSFQISADGGKTFVPIQNNDLKLYGNKPLVLKLILIRNRDIEPVAENIQAAYLYDEKQFYKFNAGSGCYVFSRTTGALAGIINTATGTVIQPAGIDVSMFSLLLKSCGKNNRRYLDMKEARLTAIKQISRKKLEINWIFSAEKIGVTFILTAKDDHLVWQIKVDNRHPSVDVIEVEGPVLSSLRISENPASDTLVWPFSAGEFITFPAEKGDFSVTYPDHAGLPFAILTNGKESFYYGCHDQKLLITSFTSAANAASDAISLKICRRHRIPAGTSRIDTFVTAVLNGSWHKGADLYRKYFYSVYPKNTYRPWLRNCDGWLQGNACGHTGLMKQYKDYTAFQHNFKAAAFLSLNYIQMWGSIFNGACPAYYLPRLDKGGEKMFAEQMKYWREHGGYVGHYYFANGIAPYYLLTDSYFGISWEKYPAEYRPPSFKWYVENREYISDSAQVDEEFLRKRTEEINDVHRKKQIVRGNYEESTGYMAMNWRNGEYADFLYKWINIYISRYHCNTAYLDTFAFRNRMADFNPYLKNNGEGDKAEFKQKFLKKLFSDMRKKEPHFCALTEGVADVYGTHLYFLLSGFARNPNIFRYTLPDQIIFQGSSNGLWSKALTRKSILQAFLCGNRFDLVLMYPETYYMLKLRQQISPFLNFASFDDIKGITVSDPAITVYAHKILPETEQFISGNGTRAITLTIGNPEGRSGTIMYELPDGFKLNSAMLCEIYKDPQPLRFQRKGKFISFQIPTGSASAVILVDTAKGANSFTAAAEQISENMVSVKVINYTEKKHIFTVDVGGVQKQLNLSGSSGDTVDFSFNIEAEAYKILPVTVTAPGLGTIKRIISIGKSGQKIPMPELSPQKTGKNLRFDFEEIVYSTQAAASGKRGFLLKGNGKFLMHSFPLDLQANAHYEMTMQIRKSLDVSSESKNCFAMIAFYTKEGRKLFRIVNCGGNVANDGIFHSVKVEFDTPEKIYKPSLYFYNHNSFGTLSVDDVNIVEISRSVPAEQVKNKSLQSTFSRAEKADKIIAINLGETEFDDSLPLQNKHVIKLKGNGKYLHRMIKLPLQAGKTYKISLMIKKGFEVSNVSHDNMVGIFNYTASRQLERYLIMASSIPPDNKFHRCQGTFKVPESVHNCALYIYNRNSRDFVTVGDIQLTEIVL
ncbi:MAG: hypothetical protein IJC27_00315 [Lentisphaeria bacterium]|nr:hypothetical protein [Lentisphaeria bacterium]